MNEIIHDLHCIDVVVVLLLLKSFMNAHVIIIFI